MKLDLLLLVVGTFPSPPPRLGLAEAEFAAAPVAGRPGLSPRSPSLSGRSRGDADALPAAARAPLPGGRGSPENQLLRPAQLRRQHLRALRGGRRRPGAERLRRAGPAQGRFRPGRGRPGFPVLPVPVPELQRQRLAAVGVQHGDRGERCWGGTGGRSPLPSSAATPKPAFFSPASEDAGCHPPTAAPTGRPLPTSTTLRRGTGSRSRSAAAPGGVPCR